MVKEHKRRSSPRKTAFWRKHVDTWRESGLSQAEYSRQAGVSVKGLGYWKRRFERERKAQEMPPTPAIVAVQLPQLQEPASGIKPLFVHLQNGLRIEIPGDFTATVLEKLLRTLERVA